MSSPAVTKSKAATTTQQLFDTSWEDAPGPGANQQSTLVTSSVFDGWNVVTSGDQIQGGQNDPATVRHQLGRCPRPRRQPAIDLSHQQRVRRLECRHQR